MVLVTMGRQKEFQSGEWSMANGEWGSFIGVETLL
jgi:hypothetical protein